MGTENFANLTFLSPRADFLRAPEIRRGDFLPILQPDILGITEQAKRCTDCGVPYCQSGITQNQTRLSPELGSALAMGCPGGKNVPDAIAYFRQYQAFVKEGNDQIALRNLQSALYALEERYRLAWVTGRICPAPCEMSCTHAQPGHSGGVTIRAIECAIVEAAIERGIYQPSPPAFTSGKRVAVIGSGPAGYVAADTLNRVYGHQVTIFEADDRLGGLMRYGIPQQHGLTPNIVDFYFQLIADEGVCCQTNTTIGRDISWAELAEQFSAIVVAVGAQRPRVPNIEGQDIPGVLQAMEVLNHQTRRLLGDEVSDTTWMKDKTVVVYGWGFTAEDAISTVGRQGAKRIVHIYRGPEIPHERSVDEPWPHIPRRIWSDELYYGSVEFADRITRHLNTTIHAIHGDGHVKEVVCVHKDTEQCEVVSADCVILALGSEPVWDSGLNIFAEDPRFFFAGDFATGPAFVITACESGRQVADRVNAFIA